MSCECKEAFDEALDLLCELADQNCSPRSRGEDSYLNSNCIGIYADLLHFLSKHGRVFITNEYGRLVEGYRILKENNPT